MTQHPFEREYSEQEAQKLNSESTTPANEDELTDEEAENVAGGGGCGSIPFPTKAKFENGLPGKDPIITTQALGEEGGKFDR